MSISCSIDLSGAGLSDALLADVSAVHIVACGSAWHVGMAAQYILEDLAELPTRVELASEFRYRKQLLDPKTLVIVISQSGETADSLAALREAKALGVRTLAVVLPARRTMSSIPSPDPRSPSPRPRPTVPS